MSHNPDLTKRVLPKELSNEECAAIFSRLSRNLARFRHTAELYATTEATLTRHKKSELVRDEFIAALNAWTEDTVKNLWLACREPGGSASATSLWEADIC